MRFHYTFTRKAEIKLKQKAIQSVDKEVTQLELSYTVRRMKNVFNNKKKPTTDTCYKNE